MDTDVAIIGAGVIGVSAAFRLQEAGLRVTLIERDGVGRGASFGNAGALAFDDIEPLASPGALRKAPRWLADPLGPLSLPPAYLPAIAPWLWRFFRAANPRTYAQGLATQAGMMRLASAESASLVEAADLAHMIRADGALDLYETRAEFEKRGWKTADKKLVKNVDLWQRLDELTRSHTIDWRWVKGHAGDPGNERADELAREGLAEARGRQP